MPDVARCAPVPENLARPIQAWKEEWDHEKHEREIGTANPVFCWFRLASLGKECWWEWEGAEVGLGGQEAVQK